PRSDSSKPSPPPAPGGNLRPADCLSVKARPAPWPRAPLWRHSGLCDAQQSGGSLKGPFNFCPAMMGYPDERPFMRQTDIAIVGGGLAGSLTAAMLGRAGVSAVL